MRILTFTLTTLLATQSYAQMGFSGEGLIELHNNHVFESDIEDNERNNTYLRAEFLPQYNITDDFFIMTHLVLEQFEQAIPKNILNEKNLQFISEGLYVQELKFQLDSEPFFIYWGKIHPNFGRAWDVGRGIYSKEFATDYELVEKIGFGGGVAANTNEFGTHTLDLNTFYSDTSILTKSLITSRPLTKLSQGGAGNTENFNSVTVDLFGENFTSFPDLTYNASYRFLHRGARDYGSTGAHEHGFALGTTYGYDICDNWKLINFIEYAYINNFGGQRYEDSGNFHDHTYVTIDAKLIMDNYFADLGYTFRYVDKGIAFPNGKDHLAQFSFGTTVYDFLVTELGYKFERSERDSEHVLGLKLTYNFEY